MTRESLPAFAAENTGQWPKTPEGAFFKVTVCLVCVFHSSASALLSLCSAFPASSALLIAAVLIRAHVTDTCVIADVPVLGLPMSSSIYIPSFFPCALLPLCWSSIFSISFYICLDFGVLPLCYTEWLPREYIINEYCPPQGTSPIMY